jgi:hypothetical protein
LHIDWVIPCRYVEVHDNLGTLIGAGIDTLWVPEMPTPVQVVMALRLTGTADELTPDHAHEARNLVRGPDGEVVSEVAGELRVGLQGARQDWLNGVVLPAVVQFEATEEGTYTVEHHVDDATSSIPIHIVHGPAPGAEAETPEED